MREGPFQFGLINDAVCEAIGDRVAFAQGERRVTYAELGSRTRRLGRVLAAAGLGCHGDPAALEPWGSCQDHVGVLALNRPEFIEAYLGTYKARATAFNINYRYTAGEIASLLRDAAAVAVVYEGRFAPVLAEALAGLPPMRLLLQIDDSSGNALLPGAVDYERALASQPEAPLDLPYTGSELYLLFTGGTTGFPKGVLWTQEDLFLHALTGQLPDEPRPTTLAEVAHRAANGFSPTMMICPPLMHGTGQWGSLITLNQGGTVVYSSRPRSLDAHAILEACERERATVMQITGDAVAIPIVNALRERSYDLGSLVAITSQAVALTPGVRRGLHELIPNALVIEAYGGSEGGFAAMRMGTAADSDIAEGGKFGAINSTAILDATKTRLLHPAEVGSVGWIARPGRMPRGYLGDEAKTRETFITVDGARYCVPGDRGSYRSDGKIQFLGREAVCINTGGEKVFGEEVESVLKTHPAVKDAVVLGLPDERLGERVTAVLSARSDGLSDEELQIHCRASLAGYKVPRGIVRVPDVPRLENGKPDYARARQIALAAVGASPPE